MARDGRCSPWFCPNIAAVAVVALLALTGGGPALALVTYFGEDLTSYHEENLTSWPYATAAENAFLGDLVTYGTESFEGFAKGTYSSMDIVFPGVVTATLTDTPSVYTTEGTGVGRYPTDGEKWVDTNGEFTIDFSAPVVSFGMYGIDMGDFGGQLTISLSSGGTPTSSYAVPHTINGNGGSVLYWGLIDTASSFDRAVFSNNNSSDYFGFDKFTVGTAAVEEPGGHGAAVPEPSSLALLACASSAIALRLKRRKKT